MKKEYYQFCCVLFRQLLQMLFAFTDTTGFSKNGTDPLGDFIGYGGNGCQILAELLIMSHGSTSYSFQSTR